MAEEADAIALYFAYVAAEAFRPRLPRGARVLDFGDRTSRVAGHLEAAGARLTTEGADAADAAFAEVHDWGKCRVRAGDLAARLPPGAPILVRLRRAPGQTPARVAHDLGPRFELRSFASLGLFVPGEGSSSWAEQHPHAFAALCALEGALRGWPLLRDAGREALLLGARRGERA